jgi:hypothetical protein
VAVLVSNFPSAQLITPIIPGDTILSVGVTQGSQFPSPIAPSYSVLVVEDVSGAKEIMHLTSRTGDALTVTRAEEGTTALNFAIDSRVELRITAGFLQNFIDGGYF